ncbi:MAG: glycoside hydrolase family 43 protein [Lachnospiraceae bacterium]|nr:glycoside hydrolase family 43 protein [Lachnospiraceae bacterium]
MTRTKQCLLCAGLISAMALTGCQSSDTSSEKTTQNASEPETVEVTKMAGGKQTSLTGVSIHDPSIFKDADGTYYIYGSHLAQATSKDLIKWTYLGTQGYTNNTVYGPLSSSLSESFQWAGMNDEDSKNGYAVWAPDITYNEEYVWSDGSKGAYMMYYCTSSTAIRSCIGYAVSKTADGPFEYVDTIIYSGFTKNSNPVTTTSNLGTKTVDTQYTNTNILDVYKEATGKSTVSLADLSSNYFSGDAYNANLYPNAIDPGLFYDADGRMWMAYGSWSGGIYLLEIDRSTGQPIHPQENITDGNSITDIYFGKKIAGGFRQSGEGPYIIYDENTNYYYLYMSYGFLTANEGYNIRMFRSESPDGPYVDAAGKEAVWGTSGHDGIGVKVMGSYNLPSLSYKYMAPGHNSALIDEDKMYLVYHQRFSTGNEGHELRIHQMLMSEEGWPCVLPYEYDGEEVSEKGYDKKEICGTYYVIKQDPTDNKTAVEYNAVSLNDDGTLSGYLTGTWEMKDKTYYIHFKIGVANYDGVLCKMTDEAGTECLVFSAVGDNNSTLWGTKY